VAIAGNYTVAATIAASDSVDQAQVGSNVAAGGVPMFDAVYVGGAGIVALVLLNGTVVNFTAIAGGVVPCKGRRVNSTNTTATLMNALYYT
jgi:hypothetical protein